VTHWGERDTWVRMDVVVRGGAICDEADVDVTPGRGCGWFHRGEGAASSSSSSCERMG